MKRILVIILSFLMIAGSYEPAAFNVSAQDEKAYGLITSEGEMLFFRSSEEYSDGKDYENIMINDDKYAGTVYCDIEENAYSVNHGVSWNNRKDEIISVSVAEGMVIKPLSMYGWFSNCMMMQRFDPNGFDTSRTVNMMSLFAGCSSLQKLDLSSFNTAECTNMSFMFFGCEQLQELELSSFNTAKVTEMVGMFADCLKLADLDLQSFDTSLVKDMSMMFENCESLKQLDLSNFQTALVEETGEMFAGCSLLESLDISSFSMASVKYMWDMFDNCPKLARVNIGAEFNKWIDESYLPEGNWTNGRKVLSEKDLYAQYPIKAAENSGTWYRNRTINKDVVRIYGTDRYKTSLLVGSYYKQLLKKDKLDAVIVTTGTAFPDAISGSYLANQLKAPILLVGNAKKVKSELVAFVNENLKPNGKIFILGGDDAVDRSWLTGADFAIEQIAGDDRYLTNLSILEKCGFNGGDLLVCTGKDFADCLSASSINIPILLVGNKLSSRQIRYLQQFDDLRFYIIGGTSAVNETVEQQLEQLGKIEIRIAGENRYDTSAKLAAQFFTSADKAIIAYGKNFPDGICGGPIGQYLSIPVIMSLSSGSALSKPSGYCKEKGIRSGLILGGPSLISDEAGFRLFQMKSSEVMSVFE